TASFAVHDGPEAEPTRRWASKLQQADVTEIRKVYATGRATQRSLARQYGVTEQAIAHLVNGRSWAWTLTSAERAAIRRRTVPPPQVGLTERLLWFTPPCPAGVSDDDHVNRWVL